MNSRVHNMFKIADMNFRLAILSGAFLMVTSCAYDDFDTKLDHDGDLVINLSGEINQTNVTRAGDSGFVNGDVMGVYVVDYNGSTSGSLQNSGNRADNVRLTFDESNNKWNQENEIYWKDGHTSVDVYGYYPAAIVDNVNSYNFTVSTNQAKMYDDGTMGDYEASDFLWGKVSGVAPSSNVIRIPLNHKMASVRVTLTEGTGFAAGEWSETKKQVLVTNTVNEAVIDLASGIVTPSGKIGKAITPSVKNDEWRAIVVPQAITRGTQLFSITVNGIPYKYSADSDLTYISGKMSNFTIKVDKKENGGGYSLTLVSESITVWENDLVSHDASAREYIVVNVETPGTLEQTILSLGKALDRIKNLKLTGKINSIDFAAMNYKMTSLQALNLQEVEITANKSTGSLDGQSNYHYNINGANEIPSSSFNSKSTLQNIVFPSKLKKIGAMAFSGCRNLKGSLILPEGLEVVDGAAFNDCTGLDGNLILPSTLKIIGSLAFCSCQFNCELSLPDSLEEIGDWAFMGNNFYGELILPDNLRSLGELSFKNSGSYTGNLIIPSNVKEIPSSCFTFSHFSGNLKLHNGIIYIGNGAFDGCGFKGELVLPNEIISINDECFSGNDFSGSLKIPNSVRKIGSKAFSQNYKLTGVLDFNENLTSIGDNAFESCYNIEGLIFSESLENIGRDAFNGCYNIISIVCKGNTPARLGNGAFNSIEKDNFALEVPESSLIQYQTAAGWSDFKRITVHYELVCRPSVACALSNEHKQTLIVDAEGEWELDYKPDWCQLSQTSGSMKTELTLTIKSGVTQGQSREGDVVFRLKGKDYTHKCHVTQFGYQYEEDEYLTLQKATKGNNGGINIVILGDGYNAQDIAEGSYLADMKQQMDYFFGIEPYTTYRDYFNVYTAFPLSTESGVGTVNTIKYNRFSTTFDSKTSLRCDNGEVLGYAMKAPTVNSGNLNRTLVILVPNSSDYGGHTELWVSGEAIAICPKSTDSYPYDSRGVVQYQAGGCGFGKLADESISYNMFASDKTINQIKTAKARGWYDNIDITGKMNQVTWSHLIFEPRYSNLVDIYEGGFGFTRGVYRSEENSCMNNYIPYFNTISRESIVKRIKQYAGETYSFEDFVANDKLDTDVSTRSANGLNTAPVKRTVGKTVIHKDNPLNSIKKSGR